MSIQSKESAFKKRRLLKPQTASMRYIGKRGSDWSCEQYSAPSQMAAQKNAYCIFLKAEDSSAKNCYHKGTAD